MSIISHNTQPRQFRILESIIAPQSCFCKWIKTSVWIKVHHICHLHCLRGIEYSTHQHTSIEWLHFAIIETKVGKSQRCCIPYFCREHKSGIIEWTMELVKTRSISFCSCIIKTKWHHKIITAINSDTGRIGSHSGNISTQGSHSTTHTYKTSSSI